MNSKTKLTALIFPHLIDPVFEGSSLSGRILVSAETRMLTAQLAHFRMMLEDVCVGLSDGVSVTLDIAVSRGEGGFVAADWDDLLGYNNFLITPPSEYFIIHEKYLSSDSKENITAKRYASTIAFIKLLQDVADFNEANENLAKCIFLLPAKLEIELKYSAKDLRSTPGLEDLAAEFGTAAKKHKDQRKMIIKVVLDEMLSNVKAENRFSHLLGSFNDFKRRVRDSYDLYVAEFSFEKVLAEVNAHKLDYTIKLNKVFSDIQNQLLAVPAALILIGGQMKPAYTFTWHNLIIMFGCLVFVIFMDLLVRNQNHTIDAVFKEIQAQENNWVRMHSEIYDRFAKPYAELERRYQHQKRLIKIVDCLVALTFLIASVFFFWYSTSPFHWIKSIF